jgi:hypothetical protein
LTEAYSQSIKSAASILIYCPMTVSSLFLRIPLKNCSSAALFEAPPDM